ncbi:MAG: elongation factor Ts [Bacteroidetes bacterium HGW-Bacteroidetes-21]|jgi:elongation factor Ts|nr:MAG: elongation factor Ts [Bacteroidetes bacterium HGW-Bacteroidetes-21]
MSQVSTADISKLRQLTGAGMMDCKNALVEAEGDFDKATEIIRKKGQAVAMKRADREAGEGCVLARVSENHKTGVVISLNCETDFVAKNSEFIATTESFVKAALEHKPADINALKELTIDGLKIADIIMGKIAAIGEKIDITYYQMLEAEMVTPYTHNGNKIACMVGFTKAVPEQVGKDIAMQIASMNPVSVTKDDVPASVIEKEIEIGKDQARQEGKPENMIEKIAMGKLNKFFKDSTLLSQDFIKDNKMSVEQYLASTDKGVKVTGFRRCSLVLS